MEKAISGVDGWTTGESRTYRVTAALPALTAGRTARENIVRFDGKVKEG